MYCYIIKYCIFASDNIKYFHEKQNEYIKSKYRKEHLNIQTIFEVLIFLLPFT